MKAQMNADLLTDDLKKKRGSNESFWLIGQPDVQLVNSGEWIVDSNKTTIIIYDDCKKLSGFNSLPFTAGKAVAVKIIDARGIESLKIIRI